MTSLFVFGQPYSASRIARAVNSRGTEVRSVFVSPKSYARFLATPPRSEPVALMRVGYRVGSTTPRGRLFDAYWSAVSRRLSGAAKCHYWLGTDVLNTLDEARSGTLRWAALASTRENLHLTVAPWLTAELESVGLPAVTALLPPPNRAPGVPAPLPAEFRVLTYLPESRLGFYGGEAILGAAERLPDVQFDVIGSRGASGRPGSANVHWHGWVADMLGQYAKATVVVRVPVHDGFGNTVIEGLQNARHVVYTHEVPHVRAVWPVTPGALVAVLEELREAQSAGRLGPNLPGRDYALETFDEPRLVDDLVSLVRARV